MSKPDLTESIRDQLEYFAEERMPKLPNVDRSSDLSFKIDIPRLYRGTPNLEATYKQRVKDRLRDIAEFLNLRNPRRDKMGSTNALINAIPFTGYGIENWPKAERLIIDMDSGKKKLQDLTDEEGILWTAILKMRGAGRVFVIPALTPGTRK